MIRIVNLNTWVGVLPRGLLGEIVALEPPGHKDKRMRALVDELVELAPDVVTFQECLPLPGFALQVAKQLDYDVFFRVANGGFRIGGVGFPPGVGGGEGLAILAKKEHRMVLLGNKKLSGTGLVTNWMSLQLGPVRYALAVKLMLRGEPIIVATSHIRYGFPSRDAFEAGWVDLHRRGLARSPNPPKWLHDMTRTHGDARDKEIKRLAAWLLDLRAKNQGAPVLLGADMNLDADTPQLADFLAYTGYRNTLSDEHPGILTWDPRHNANIAYSVDFKWPDGKEKSTILQMMAYLDAIPQCPDHVMLSPGLACRQSRRVFDRPRGDVFASDHYGICVDAERVA